MSSQSRHVYTRDERVILEASFAHQSHPDINEKERLAKILNCNIIQISNWFQNLRRRVKKQQKSILLNTSRTTNTIPLDSPTYQTTYYYHHQPNCPFNNNTSSYSYYPPSSQYVYTHEPSFYTQPTFVDPYLVYEQ